MPSKRVKESTEGTVDQHASKTHPEPQEITIRWRGGPASQGSIKNFCGAALADVDHVAGR